MRRRVTHARTATALLLLLPIVAARASAQSPAPAAPSPSDDPLARRGWHLDLTVHGAGEVANYNGNHEEMLGAFAGFSYGIREGLAVKVATPLYYVWQRGTDGYLLRV